MKYLGVARVVGGDWVWGGLGQVGVGGGVSGGGRSRGVRGWLWFLCGVAQCGGGLVSGFRGIFAIIGGILSTFQLFPNFLGPLISSRSVTRETTRVYHAYK